MTITPFGWDTSPSTRFLTDIARMSALSLDACWCAAEIELCVAVIALVRLGREPTIEVVTIAKQKSARVTNL